MTAANQLYQAWLADPQIDAETKAELQGLAGNEKEIEDRFYRELEFGTGGLRGVIGAGTNRINRYTVGKATQGLAQFVNARYGAGTGQSAVIAYDSRHMSPEFALEAALVLAGNGVKTYMYTSVRSTPQLSFSVRELGCVTGIVITASHNPPEYNGYKVYGNDGGQLTTNDANAVITEIRGVDFPDVKRLTQAEAEAAGLLVWLGADIDTKFVDAITSVSSVKQGLFTVPADFKVVYTPLHGTGNKPMLAALGAIGVNNVHVVAEQAEPDSKFTTVKSPNPEEKEAFTLAIKLAEEVGADIIVGTDPDADRMGAVVKNAAGEYVVLTGNQSGAILVDYLFNRLERTTGVPSNAVLIKTIVTSEMGATIAASYGAKVVNTLTGFKYIGEKMTQYAADHSQTYIFGYEESYGYLAGTHARDKDAIVAGMLIVEAAAYYKTLGKSLDDVLQELYAKHGYFLEALESRTLKGKDGVEKIQTIMSHFRNNAPKEVNGIAVSIVKDYAPGIDGLPKYFLADGSWFCLRPSGTEPKIKVYFAVEGTSSADAKAKVAALIAGIMKEVDAFQ
jgi:phosphoglucomutase